MSQYMILIYDDEAAMAQADPTEFRQLLDDHGAFMEKHTAALRGGSAVQPSSTATAIRRDRSGDAVVNAGPFHQTKESLGGYYLIEAEDLDEALTVAKQVPARFGGVEVRPVRVFD
jgi:hypothetical protein